MTRPIPWLAAFFFPPLLLLSAPSPAAETQTAAVNEFASFGVVIPPMPQWYRYPEGRTGMIARWADQPQGSTTTLALMSLEMEPADGRTAEQYTDEQIKEHGGMSLPAPVAMGGEKAIWHRGGKIKEMEAFAVASLIARHGNYIYVIGGFAGTLHDLPLAAMQKLAQEIKFAEFVEPWKNTRLREKAYPFPFGHFTWRSVATMRPGPDAPPPHTAIVGIENNASNQPELIMSVTSMPNPYHVSLEQAANNYTGKIAPGQSIAWGFARTSKPQRAMTKSFPVKLIAQRGGGAAGTETLMRIGMVQIGDGEFALMTFNICVTDPRGIEAYEKAIEEVVRSVEPTEK